LLDDAAVSESGVTSDRVVVIGRARRAVQPDVANLVFTVVEVDSDQRAGFARCGERVNALVTRLRATVGDQAVVSTGHVDVDRDYSDDDGSARPARYATSCPVMVECGPATAGPVIAEAIAAGVERLHGPSYRIRDPSPITDDLLREAVLDARRKALRLSEAAERELGQTTTVEEVHDDDYSHAMLFESSRAVSASSGGGMELEPARLELATTVRVTIALAPA
jgi:uncharacterized protein YggE